MAGKIKVTAELETDHVADRLTKSLATVQAQLKKTMFRALTILEFEILNNIRTKSGLTVRSGRLLNSIGNSKHVVVESDGSVSGEIGPKGVPYGRIQELGGTIVPVKAKALTIPTDFNRRRDGTPKVTTSQLSDKAFSRKGILFDVEGTGAAQKLLPMFILKKSVTIKARPYLAPALAAKQDEIAKTFGIFLSMAFKGKS